MDDIRQQGVRDQFDETRRVFEKALNGLEVDLLTEIGTKIVDIKRLKEEVANLRLENFRLKDAMKRVELFISLLEKDDLAYFLLLYEKERIAYYVKETMNNALADEGEENE